MQLDDSLGPYAVGFSQTVQGHGILTEKKSKPAAALVKVLSPEQQEVLKRAAHEAMGERMMMMHRFEDGRGGPMGPHRMDMRDHAPMK